jgi:hypothetical protein
MSGEICNLNEPVGLFDKKPKTDLGLEDSNRIDHKVGSEAHYYVSDEKLEDNNNEISEPDAVQEFVTQKYYDPVTKQTHVRVVNPETGDRQWNDLEITTDTINAKANELLKDELEI